MFTAMSQALRRQIEATRLAFCCEDCANFVPEPERCSLLYPNEDHRRAKVAALKDGERVWFCKMFEPS
jgi:hypothetical protein